MTERALAAEVAAVPSQDNSVVAVGTFDGVHLGHRAVLYSTSQEARRRGVRAVAVTFDRHPLALFRPSDAPRMLADGSEKVELMRQCGIDDVCVLPFEKDIADMAADEFVRLLLERYACECLVMGHDNAVGRGRAGTPAYIGALADSMGFSLKVIGPVRIGGEVVSSSEVRRRLASGDVATAAAMLGRRYQFSSRIVHGDGRGHTLGVATANLEVPPDRFMPCDGVYATLATMPGCNPMMSVTNIGVRPTFYDGSPGAVRTTEVHLLDTSGSIYGQEMRLEFVDFLRGEMRFDSSQALVEQIRRDIARSRQLLASI